MKKVIAIVLMALLASSAAIYAAGYPDVTQGNWAYEAVNAMSAKRIITGHPDGAFKPNDTVTYGELIKMALIADTSEDVGNSPTGNWASGYYDKALERRYFTAYDIEKSDLNNKITRAHMALIISSILGDVKIDNYDKIQEGVTDINYKTAYEYDIMKSYATGILTGYTDNTFRPDKTLTRAEAATVIYRLVDESKRVLPGTEKETVAEETEQGKTYKTGDFLDLSKLTQNRIGTKYANFTDTYEFYSDASVWDIKMFRPFDGEDGSFDHTLKGFIYLVKDGVIMDYCQTLPMYDSDGNYLGYQRSIAEYDITKADYITSVPTDSKSDADQLIKVVVNPFKL